MAVGTAGPGSGIAPSYVFLSYASADRERAFRVADLLEASGISVWLDRKSIAAGSSWSAEIVRGIKGCQALLVLVSVTAMASANVQQEVQLAWESHRPILPLLQERVVLPASVEYALAGRQWVELLERPEEQWLPEHLWWRGTDSLLALPRVLEDEIFYSYQMHRSVSAPLIKQHLGM
jgi:hypothetical protein